MNCEDKKNFLKIAYIIAERSKCSFFKVGCILVKDGRIISSGYNGTPIKYDNCNSINFSSREEHKVWSDRYEIHSEMNAIIFAARHGVAIDKCIAFSTLQPCWNCTKNLIQSGIVSIIFNKRYDRISDSEERDLKIFIRKNNVMYEQIEL